MGQTYAFHRLVASLLRDLAAGASSAFWPSRPDHALVRTLFRGHCRSRDVAFANSKPSVIVAPQSAAVMRRW